MKTASKSFYRYENCAKKFTVSKTALKNFPSVKNRVQKISHCRKSRSLKTPTPDLFKCDKLLRIISQLRQSTTRNTSTS
jgi:hypothetical protein